MAFPGNKGKRCQSWQRVPSRFGGRVERCASYGAASRGRRKRSGGYRKRVPFNKGKTCKSRKQVWSAFFKKDVTRCASFKNGIGATAPAMPQPVRVSETLFNIPGGGYMPGRSAATPVIAFMPNLAPAQMPAYARAIYEARQMSLPKTGRPRGPRQPTQASLPFQTGLPRMATPPPPPPPRASQASKKSLTDHERLMLAVRQSPGRFLDGL